MMRNDRLISIEWIMDLLNLLNSLVLALKDEAEEPEKRAKEQHKKEWEG